MCREVIDSNLLHIEETEAEEKFQRYEYIDPLPDVPPALLNSGDIFDYSHITGMICPLTNDANQLQRKLKPASYEVDFLGTVYFVDEKGEPQEIEIKEDSPFTIKKNSIAYIFIQTTFRLPAYIALRFNLKICHVHRGLLLGTGPLVDPGFCGRLFIPLHNLTSKDYTLKGGDGLIWVEFTKISPHKSWNEYARKNAYNYIPFPNNKRFFTPQQYLNKATDDGQPAKSSIPGEVMAAKEAADKAEKFSKRLFVFGLITLFISLATIVIGAISMAISTYNVANSASKNITDFRGEIAQIDQKMTKNQQETQKMIDALTAEFRALRTSGGANANISRLPKQNHARKRN